MKPRKIKTNWDLTLLLKKENDKEIEKQKNLIKKENYEFINKWKDRNDYLKKAAVLRIALDEYEKLNRLRGNSGGVGFYFYLKSALDQNDPGIKAQFNNIRDFEIKISNDLQFFEHNIARIPESLQPRFLAYKGLEPYRHFLEKLFIQAKCLLSDAEEKILNLKQATSRGNWVKMLSGFLSKEERIVLNEKGKKEKKNYSELAKLANSRRKKVRDAAAIALNDIFKKHADTAENEINSVLADKKINDELRKMERPDLARHLDDDVESDVVDALIRAVSAKFSVSRRYYGLKAKLLGVKKLEYHERNVEYGKIDQKYPYPKAFDLVSSVFSALDKEFFEALDKMNAKGEIDVWPKKNKTSGAFCASNLITQPNYILLNYGKKLDDVLTLAHELGHAVNSELQKKTRNSLSFGAPKSTAEVASTFMEDFVLEELMKNADKETRLALMAHKLNSDVSTIFRQVACYLFERELHQRFREKGYLSKEEIGKLFQKHMRAYMGSAVSQSPGSENWWIGWGHIRSFFYNYSYASGLLISKYMQASCAKDHAFLEKVKEFLSAGVSDSPKNIFQKMGIDITDKKFWDDGLEKIENLLKDTEKLAKKLGKI